MYIILSILLVLAILYIVCVNTLDKWRFRADRQYPYVRELMDEWEQVTRRLLDAAGGQVPDVHVAGQKHPWDAVAAADQLAARLPGSGPVLPPLRSPPGPPGRAGGGARRLSGGLQRAGPLLQQGSGPPCGPAVGPAPGLAAVAGPGLLPRALIAHRYSTV